MVQAHEHMLTARQEECVRFDGSTLLIRGEPGSGKSMVLLRRARKLAERDGPTARIVVFAFNKALVRFAGELVKVSDLRSIEVVTFHSWAVRLLRHLGMGPNIISAWERTDTIASAFRTMRDSFEFNRRVASFDVAFFEDEFAWIKGRALKTLAEYQRADRAGRGMALKAAERQSVWSVFEQYTARLERRRKCDWDDLAVRLLDRLDRIPASQRIDHVLVDEAQDLQEAELRILREVALKTLTIAADEGQKIYKRTFTWQSLGINVRGSGTKRLTTSFRSTRQIIELANCLRKRDRLASEGQNAIEYLTPTAEGVLPTLTRTASPVKEEEGALNIVKVLMSKYPDRTIGILGRERRMLHRMTELLKEHGIAFENVLDDVAASIISPGVKVSTFHSAKGLEFDFVILTQLTEGIVPGEPPRPLAEIEPGELEEYLAVERRLVYVSMTRAKFGLFMTCGGAPSRFLDELDPALYTEMKM